VIWNNDHTTNEEFVWLLLKTGWVTSGRTARLREMEIRRCHDNSTSLAREVNIANVFEAAP
jgi:hypothetical protein